MNRQQEAQRNRGAAVFIFIFLACLIAAGIYFLATAAGIPMPWEQAPSSGTSSPAQDRPAAVTPFPQPTARSNTVGNWSGSTNKQTETFHIASPEWTIKWRSTEGYFSVAVRDAEGHLVKRAVDLIGSGSDSTIMRGTGDFFLDINARASYSVTVTASR